MPSFKLLSYGQIKAKEDITYSNVQQHKLLSPKRVD